LLVLPTEKAAPTQGFDADIHVIREYQTQNRLNFFHRRKGI